MVCLTLKNGLSQYTGTLVPARALKLGVHPENLRSQYIPSYKGRRVDFPYLSYRDFPLTYGVDYSYDTGQPKELNHSWRP